MADKTDTVPPIECLWGTPYQDANGVWKCPDSPTGPTATPVGDGANRRMGRRGNINIYLGSQPPAAYPTMTIPDTPPANPTKIFGMSVPVALAVGVGALLLLSSMSGGQTQQRTR